MKMKKILPTKLRCNFQNPPSLEPGALETTPHHTRFDNREQNYNRITLVWYYLYNSVAKRQAKIPGISATAKAM